MYLTTSPFVPYPPAHLFLSSSSFFFCYLGNRGCPCCQAASIRFTCSQLRLNGQWNRITRSFSFGMKSTNQVRSYNKNKITSENVHLKKSKKKEPEVQWERLKANASGLIFLRSPLLFQPHGRRGWKPVNEMTSLGRYWIDICAVSPDSYPSHIFFFVLSGGL